MNSSQHNLHQGTVSGDHAPEPDRESLLNVEDNAPRPQPQLLDLDLPQAELDLTMTLESILSESTGRDPEPETQKVQKRASNVLKLAQENAKLQEELRAMNERLEAAERRQKELAQRARSGQNTSS